MKPVMFALCAGFVASCALAKDDARAQNVLTPEQARDIEAICAKTACRTGGYDVVVRIHDNVYVTLPVNRSPYIMPDGDILIYPGETIAVQFTIDGDKLSAPRFFAQYATPHIAMKIDMGAGPADNPLDRQLPPVPKVDGPTGMTNALPPNTVLISYGQFPDKPAMEMELQSSLPRRLKLDAALSEINGGGYIWEATSTCPLSPDYGNSEFWPEPHGPVRLSHVRFLSADAKGTCN